MRLPARPKVLVSCAQDGLKAVRKVTKTSVHAIFAAQCRGGVDVAQYGLGTSKTVFELHEEVSRSAPRFAIAP